MKLYYTPGACSLATHIILREGGFRFDTVRVDLATHRTETGEDFFQITPKGYVPALELPDGIVITENQVILQYLADQAPEKNLAPASGTLDRYRLMEWLAYIATELHKGFGPLWNPKIPADVRQMALERLADRFSFVDKQLTDQPFLCGKYFSIADAYLFTVLNWTHYHAIDLSPWPHLVAYQHQIGERPAIQAALKAEGLTA